jgi:hypothetical protein
MQQLEILLSSKIKEEGWTLGVEHPRPPVEINGPIPSIMLFLFTIVIQIVESPQPHEKRQLSIVSNREGKLISWKMRWPSEARVVEPIGDLALKEEQFSTTSMRQEMIRELTLTCNAEVQESRDQRDNQILIRGAWG